MYQAFQPPLYWQQFEDLTQAVFPYIYGDPRPQKVGRPGQAQNGVDVYGKFLRAAHSGLIGIQCKRMDELDENNDPYPGGKITAKLLRKEYQRSLVFKPSLKEWVFATTAKRDESTQRLVRMLDQESRSRGRCGVSVWFWDDYVTDLNRYADLQRQYYQHVLNAQNASDLDKMTLELYAHAFSRPAFQDSFHAENPDDFLQALKDTMRALNTGELLDRHSRNVIRRAIGGRRAIQNDQWRQGCDAIYSRLQKLKIAFQTGLHNNSIKKHGSSLQITPQLERRLQKLRSSCISDLNVILRLAGLRTI